VIRSIFVMMIVFPLSAFAQPAAEQTSAQKADKVVKSSNGMFVRVVGAAFDKDAAVTKDTGVGDVVEVQSVNGQVLCNVVIYATAINKSEFYKDKDGEPVKMVGTMPNVPELDFAEGVRGCYMMPGSCKAGICAWNVLLRGAECRKVGSLPYYVASTIKEIWDMPSARARLLVTDGMCGEDNNIPCTVSLGDPRAIPNRKIRFNHSWAGRWSDLNFRQMRNGKYLERVRPDKLGVDGKAIMKGIGGPK